MKEELGLAHFEGRSWRGFHHHVCLVMMAYGFLALEQLRARRDPAEPGKKRLCSESRPEVPSDRENRGVSLSAPSPVPVPSDGPCG
jgi:SRSO17 transposase